MNKVLTNMNQDLSALEKQTARGNIGAEDASNRVTSIDESSTDAQYPSAKCVFNALQNVGGGGYKDGGQLTPAQYITVPNNVIADYDNSADEINFIIEDDGNPHNSIIQVSTSVNATVNVYELRNGFYYLLGVVGSNTINAGDDYKINIVGDSFSIEQVSLGGVTPEFAVIGGQTVKVYASLDKTVLFTSNDAFDFKNNENSITFAESVGWGILDSSVRFKFEAANIPISNSGYFNGSYWQNVGTRAIIFNGPNCNSARGYENVSSNPQGGDYGTSSPAYLASLVLYKLL